MIVHSGWRWQLGCADERAQFLRSTLDLAGGLLPAAADVTLVSPHAVGGVAFEVIPDLRCGIECRRIGWKRFQVQPGIGLAHRREGRPAMHAATVSQEHHVSQQMPQEQAQDVRHVHGLEVVRLPAEVQSHMLVFPRDGEGRQAGEAVMFVVVAGDGRVPRRRSGPATRWEEQKAALIREGEMGTTSSGFFYRRPCGALPMHHGLFVAWHGSTLWHLTAPAQATPRLPDMGWVIAHAERHVKHRNHAP